MNLRDAIHTQPMRRLQVVAVAICLAITMIDGYEILVMAFVAPTLATSWGLSQVTTGYLLSSGVFGMAVRAAVLSPLSDRFGRRNYILGSLLLISIGMVLSGLSTSVPMLLIFRALAGLFIGGIVASINTLVAEYSSDRRRGTVMGIYGVGFPAGAALGGAITAPLIALGGWRAPFFFGATVTLIMFFVALAALPESVEYLVEKRPKGALATYNRIAAKLGHPPADRLPAARSTATTRAPRSAIFGGVMLRRTIWLWLGYAMLTAAFYFANTWTPKLVSDATGDPSLGVRAGVMVTAGGVLGALLFAALALVIRPRLVNMLLMFGGTAAFVLYATNFQQAGLALFLAVLVGMFANGGIAGYYAISPPVYPAAVRGTGVGLMIAFGRGVSILAPILVGYVLAGGWRPEEVYQLFAAVLAVAGVANWLLDRTYRGRSEDPETPDTPAVAEPATRTR